MSLLEQELERRRAVRQRTILGGNVSARAVSVVDLSSTGFGATANEPLPEVGECELHLPDGPVRVQVRLCWSREIAPTIHHVGYEISGFQEPDDAEVLERYLKKLQREEKRSHKGPLRDLSEPELERLALLARVSRSLNASHEYEKTLVSVVEALMETLAADRGMILLDRGGPIPQVVVRRGEVVRSHRGLEFSMMVVEEVMATGQPIMMVDVEGDARFGSSDSLRNLETISILCVPLRSRERSLGMIYLDSSSTSGLFKKRDLELATILADLAVAAVERAEVFTRLLRGEKLAALGTLVAGLAHELRNPLNAIINLADMGRAGEAEPGDSVHIYQQARRCDRLINDLLRAARGGEHTTIADVAAAEVFTRVTDLVGAQFRNQGVELVTERGPEKLTLRADPEHLIQVFINLLTNAIHALTGTPEPRVEWSVTVSGGKAVFTVADNGPGIPEEATERIFDPFYTTRAPSGGSGLGLAIVARLMEAQGGSVVAGNRPNGGAVFTVTVPQPIDQP